MLASGTMADIEGRLLQKQILSPKSLLARVQLPRDFAFRAGQYVVLRLPLKDGEVYERPFSIASPPTHSGEGEFLVARKASSKGAQFFEEAAEGAVISLRGPFGSVVVDDKEKPLHFIAAGLGAVPFRAICKDLFEKKYKESVRLTLLREPAHWAVFDEELVLWHRTWKQFSYSVVHTTIEQATHPAWQWRHLGLGKPEHGEVLYISGSKAFVAALKSELQKRGFAPEQVITENM